MTGMVWPLAKGEDLLGTLIVIVIVIISAVAQLIGKAREVQKQAGRPKPPAEPLPPQAQDPLADEIEDFLKRASQRRRATGSRPAAPIPLPAAEAPTRRLVQADLIPMEGAPESVAAHVRDHLSSAKFAPVSQQLGREVTQIDGKIERHLLEKFDHRLGRLAGMGGESASAQTAVDLEAPRQGAAVAPLAAANLAAVLANPASLRQAILLSEVLNRPESRWT
jgi:hypothetical protein